MKILILNWRDIKHPHAGGAEKVTFEHAKAWVKGGHTVYHFSSGFKNCERKEKIGGILFYRFGCQYLGVQMAAFFWYLFGKHERFDIVVDQFHGTPFFTPIFVRRPKLAFIHEVAKEVWSLNPWPKPFYWLPAFLGPVFEPLVFKLFYKKIPFMTVSESTKQDLVSWGIPAQNITVIHNGVTIPSTLNPQPLTIKRPKVALYLGALSRDKGIEDALKVFSQVSREDKSWRFWVVGKGDETMRKFLISYARKLGIDKNVKFWGYVSEKKKFELLAKAHVLVNPSYHEGWGLVNIEANAVGTPVVAYDVPGCRDSVRSGETGILVKKGDFKKLAQEILTLVNDRERYERLSQNAIKWSKKFTWEKAVKKSLELIESL